MTGMQTQRFGPRYVVVLRTSIIKAPREPILGSIARRQEELLRLPIEHDAAIDIEPASRGQNM